VPDYAMCRRIDCQRRGGCRRYLAWPKAEGQDYAHFEPKTCTQFLNAGYGTLRTLKQADEANSKAVGK